MYSKLAIKLLILESLRYYSVAHNYCTDTGFISVASMIIDVPHDDGYVVTSIQTSTPHPVTFSVCFTSFGEWFGKLVKFYNTFRHFNISCLPLQSSA